MSTSSNITDAPHWNTSEHHGPVVSVVSWLLIIAVVLAVTARAVTRYALIKSLRWDDLTILLAMVLAIGQTVTASIESSAGLGSRTGSLSIDEFLRFQKSNYASNLFYVTIIGMVKASVCLHIYGLTPIRLQRVASVAVGGFCALWALVSFIVAAFECKLPHAWELTSGKCINLLAFWTSFGILNIITDLALIALPVPIIIKLQVSLDKKAVILGCYGMRFFAMAAAILQLYYLRAKTSKSTDFIYDLWVPALCTQAVIAFSIISACFPFLKFLIDALETGMVRIETRPANLTSKFGSSGGIQYGSGGGGGGGGGEYYKAQGSQFKQKPSTGASRNLGPSTLDSSHVNHSDVLRMDDLHSGGGNINQGNQLHSVATKASKKSDDIDSLSSQTHIIRKVEWSLTEEHTGLSHV